jgi:hypothetical protein
MRALGLLGEGGNYRTIRAAIARLGIETGHLKGRQWNKGGKWGPSRRSNLSDVLIVGRYCQTYKLRKRLVAAGLKEDHCELCGWDEMAADGRRPLELDHINGNPLDNRIENLRVLCPNCHSLQPTHRALNSVKKG